MNTLGTGKNANIDGQKGTEKVKPPHKKATKASQIKTSQNKGDKANKGNLDTLLGDPMVNTKKGTYKAKEKGQKDTIGINDIGIFEFIFQGLPNLPDLEGVDEDRLRELQNAIQEQLHQRDEERERNITKRVQDFEKTFDFVNSHLLKGVATMVELTKTDNRHPIGKIRPTDKMVMMLSLFDGTKPEMSKQHYERFNLYINFQTKSGHLTDPIGEANDLFKYTLDKAGLVWFQMNRSKFKDLIMLKTMFLQRYNPWGKTKREQLQSWNILSFDPKKTDIDEHIDLINTLGDMVDQKEEAKREKFIGTMPTMIQTHLIICKDWADVKDKAKSLKHIIRKCDPLTTAMPLMATGATVPGLYSHIAHLVDKEEGKIPSPFKGAKPKQTEVEVNLKENLRIKDRTHLKPKRHMKCTHTIALTIIITMIIILPQVRVMAADLLMVKAVTDNLEVSHREAEAKDLSIINVNFRIIDFGEAHFNRTVCNTATAANPTFRDVKQITTEVKAMARVLSYSEDMAVVGPIIRVTVVLTNISITHMNNRQNNTAHLVACAAVSIIPLSTVTKENMT